MIITGMLIGFSICPSALKSQSIQQVAPISFTFTTIKNYSDFIDDDINLMQSEYVKTDSLKRNTDFSKQKNSAKDKINPLRIQTSDKIIKKKSYRNMPVTIQIRI